MSEFQKPSMGRVVHYHGVDLDWHLNMSPHRPSPPTRGWAGPFAATIVFVHETGQVNLRVDYPCPIYMDGGCISEIRVNVPHRTDNPGVMSGYWDWPPRLP